MKVERFVICMNNDEYGASLELHKVYGVIDPLSNDPDDYIRVIDESGEDYLYPSAWFEDVALGATLEGRLMESLAV
jgi:hypothetical protein